MASDFSPSADQVVPALWSRLLGWLDDFAPELIGGLRPGAGAAEIARTESDLGVLFPEDFRESLRCHDGESSGNGLLGMSLLPMHEIVAARGRLQKEAAPEWHSLWLPISSDSAGNYLCLDLDPGPRGAPGQVVLWWHEQRRAQVRAASFAALLATYVEALERRELMAVEINGSFLGFLRPSEVGRYPGASVRSAPAPGAPPSNPAQTAASLLAYLKGEGCLDASLGPLSLLFASRVRTFLAVPFASERLRAERLYEWLKGQQEIVRLPFTPHELRMALRTAMGQ